MRHMPLLIFFITLIVFSLTRTTLMFLTGMEVLPPPLWPMILIKGLWFDLLVSAVFASPVCLYEALVPTRWRSKGWHQKAGSLWLWGLLSFLLFVSVVEAAFWIEFSTRINFIAVDYLLYTNEVIGDIHESYPLGWIFFSISVVSAVAVRLLRPIARPLAARPVSKRTRARLIAVGLALPPLCFALGNIDQMSPPV